MSTFRQPNASKHDGMYGIIGNSIRDILFYSHINTRYKGNYRAGITDAKVYFIE